MVLYKNWLFQYMNLASHMKSTRYNCLEIFIKFFPFILIEFFYLLLISLTLYKSILLWPPQLLYYFILKENLKILCIGLLSKNIIHDCNKCYWLNTIDIKMITIDKTIKNCFMFLVVFFTKSKISKRWGPEKHCLLWFFSLYPMIILFYEFF